jgi:hypothetical protein
MRAEAVARYYYYYWGFITWPSISALARNGFIRLFFDSVPPVVPERLETTPSLTADEEF